jgi:phosphoenolpyruvate carboxylase
MLNGGLYTLLEATEAYRRGFPLLLVEDSGRLAQVLSEYIHMHGENGPTSETHPDEMYRMIMSAVEKLPAEVAQEFTEKDFGRAANPENDDYLVYREYLYRLLKVIEYSQWAESKSGGSQITTMKSADITPYLNNFYAQEFKGNRSGPSPIPAIKKWESAYFDKPRKK